jgi:acyl carrier protein
MKSQQSKKLLTVISKILKIDIKEINSNFNNKNTKSWDSINHIKLLIELEKKFKKKVETSDYSCLTSFKKLKKYFIKN